MVYDPCVVLLQLAAMLCRQLRCFNNNKPACVALQPGVLIPVERRRTARLMMCELYSAVQITKKDGRQLPGIACMHAFAWLDLKWVKGCYWCRERKFAKRLATRV
jgi:hypothetical protein